jgi:hypothetical protein
MNKILAKDSVEYNLFFKELQEERSLLLAWHTRESNKICHNCIVEDMSIMHNYFKFLNMTATYQYQRDDLMFFFVEEKSVIFKARVTYFDVCTFFISAPESVQVMQKNSSSVEGLAKLKGYEEKNKTKKEDFKILSPQERLLNVSEEANARKKQVHYQYVEMTKKIKNSIDKIFYKNSLSSVNVANPARFNGLEYFSKRASQIDQHYDYKKFLSDPSKEGLLIDYDEIYIGVYFVKITRSWMDILIPDYSYSLFDEFEVKNMYGVGVSSGMRLSIEKIDYALGDYNIARMRIL